MAKPTKPAEPGTNIATLPSATSQDVELAKRGLTDDEFQVLKQVVFADPDSRIAGQMDAYILIAFDYCTGPP